MKGIVVIAGAAAVAVALILVLRNGGEEVASSGSDEPLPARVALGSDGRGPGQALPSEPTVAELGAPDARRGDEVASARRAVAPEPETATGWAPAVARIGGRVVGDLTGEPVPFFRFDVLAADDPGEELETDGAGRFESERDYPAGAYTLDLTGDRHPKNLIQSGRRAAFKGWVWTHTHEHVLDDADLARGSTDVELALPVGPTFKLHVLAPPEVAIGALEVSLRAADMRFAHDHIYGTVHAGASPWVRFSPVARLMEGGPPYRLKLMSADGLWYGDAPVEEFSGIRASLVEIELGARGAVRGVVRRNDGSGNQGWVQLWGEGATFDTGEPDERPQLTLAGEDGGFHQRWILPGKYILKAEAGGHEPLEEEIQVVAGETLELDLRLERKGDSPADTGVIRGRVVSETGTFDGEVRLFLIHQETRNHVASTEAAWHDEGARRVGTFEFEGLSHDAHDVLIFGQSLFAITPGELTVTPDRRDLELLVHDAAESTSIVLRAVDRDTGDRVETFEAWLTLEPGTDRERMAHVESEDGAAEFEGIPVELPWELRVKADDYTHVWRTSETLAPDQESREVVMELVRGWSTRVSAFGPGTEPLAGVNVFFDDELAGFTDVNGKLTVYLAAVPERLRVEYLDWEVVPSSEFDRETGLFRSYYRWVNVILLPPE